MGCLLQFIAGSLTANFGPQAKKERAKYLELGWVYLLATEMHNTTVRVPYLEPGRAVAPAIIGENDSWKLVRDHAEQLLVRDIPRTQKAGETA